MLLEQARSLDLPIWKLAALTEAHGAMAGVFIRVARYLKVDLDELIRRHEAGQHNWVNWAVVAINAEYEAQDVIRDRAANPPHDVQAA